MLKKDLSVSESDLLGNEAVHKKIKPRLLIAGIIVLVVVIATIAIAIGVTLGLEKDDDASSTASSSNSTSVIASSTSLGSSTSSTAMSMIASSTSSASSTVSLSTSEIASSTSLAISTSSSIMSIIASSTSLAVPTVSLTATSNSPSASVSPIDPNELDVISLQGIALSAYAYDYDEEGTNILDASNLNVGLESTVIPFLKMAGTSLQDQTTPNFSKFEYTYDWVYRHSINSDYKVWLMIDGNFHLSDKEGVSFGGNTQAEVDVWVDALMVLLVDTPWGTYKWPEGKLTTPAEMPGLMGFHFDIEPHKKITTQYDGYCLFLKTLREKLEARGFGHLQISIYAHHDLVTDSEDTRIFKCLNHPKFMIGVVGADLGPQSNTPISPETYEARLSDIVKDFVDVASMVNYEGRIGAILPAAGQESEFSHLTEKDSNTLYTNFDWTMQEYTRKALLTIQKYTPDKIENNQIPITEALFWRLAPWPLSLDGYGKRPACLTHFGQGNNVTGLLASVWPKVS